MAVSDPPIAEGVTDVREISRIAYGFIASKALFTALDLGLFRCLSVPLTLAELADCTGVDIGRLRTLTSSLIALRLLIREGERYANAPAVSRYLIPGAPAYFGDYYRLQVARQIYPALMHLEAGVRGDVSDLAHQSTEAMLSDPAEAEAFTRAQHAGSTGPALLLARRFDLGEPLNLLDVAGGSGAFSIALCNRYPHLKATIIDFPTVVASAGQFVAEARLETRISLIAGNAFKVDWPHQQDVVLMSYLLSAVAEADIDGLVERAYSALRPGGLLLVHDFMLDDDRSGPLQASLWFLQYLAYQQGVVSLTQAELDRRLSKHGFTVERGEALVPGITRLVVCRRRS